MRERAARNNIIRIDEELATYLQMSSENISCICRSRWAGPGIDTSQFSAPSLSIVIYQHIPALLDYVRSNYSILTLAPPPRHHFLSSIVSPVFQNSAVYPRSVCRECRARFSSSKNSPKLVPCYQSARRRFSRHGLTEKMMLLREKRCEDIAHQISQHLCVCYAF